MRSILLLLMIFCSASAGASEVLWSELRAGPAVLVIRHAATEPGIGDPPGFRLGDCATQRNLSAEGRAAARAIGQKLKSEGIPIGEVRSSAWCRTEETARLLGFASPRREPVLNSFFGERAREGEAAAALRAIIAGWSGPGVLVLVTHQVNITAATGVNPAPGEIVVLKPRGTDFTLAGRLRL